MVPEIGDRLLFKHHVLAMHYEHRLFHILRWQNENKRAYADGVWMVCPASLGHVKLSLVAGKKIKRVPVRLFERWLSTCVAKEILGKS